MKKTMILFMIMILLIPNKIVNAAGAIKNVSYEQNVHMSPLTIKLMEKISKSTPAEHVGSDLKVLHPATRISTARLPQSYAFDHNYYYFLSNTTNVGKKKNTLRLTRVKYDEKGHYTQSYMTLSGFGHGTNIDCTTFNGTTWIWTGSDNSSTISCFQFQPGKTIKNHASIHYKITEKGSKKMIRGISPAIDPSGTLLAVRYKDGGKQCFQYYKLKKGKQISPKKVIKKVTLSCPKTTFQGFDIAGQYIYTVEGTRSATECKDIHEKYEPIRVRIYYIGKNSCKVRNIKGATKLLHREPEGIKVNGEGGIFLNIASHYKNKYTCVNVYQVQ